jgi:hypothetical protein
VPRVLLALVECSCRQADLGISFIKLNSIPAMLFIVIHERIVTRIELIGNQWPSRYRQNHVKSKIGLRVCLSGTLGETGCFLDLSTVDHHQHFPGSHHIIPSFL